MEFKLKNNTSTIETCVFLLIIAIAAYLRAIGISWGMPYAYHPDERILVARSVYFFSGDFNPHLFIYPSLQMYISFLVNQIVYWIGHLSGIFPTVRDFTALYRANPTIFYHTGRCVVVIFALFSVLSTFFIAQKIFGKRTAFISCFLLAILPVHVLHSHYVTTDVPCILFVLISFYYALRIIDEDHWPCYLLAGVFAGLAASIKYNGGLVALMIIAAHLIKVWSNNKMNLLPRLQVVLQSILTYRIFVALAASIACYLITSPYTLLDFKTFLKDFTFQVSVQRRGHGLIFLGIDNKFLYHIFTNFRYWGGTPIWLLMIAGLLTAIAKLNKYRLLFLIWIGLYFVALASSNDLFIRYGLLLTPFVLILTADLMNTLIFYFRKPFLRHLAYSVCLMAVIYMGLFSLIMTRTLARTDVRTTAKQWFEGYAREGATIGIMLSSAGMVSQDDPPIDEKKYVISRDKSLKTLIDRAPEWLVISSYDYVDFIRLGDKYEFTRENYNLLTQLKTGQGGYALVKELNYLPRCLDHSFLGKYPSHDMMYSFPVILFYQRNTN